MTFDINELRVISAALDHYTELSDERQMLHAVLIGAIESEIQIQEEILEFAGVCEGGACTL